MKVNKQLVAIIILAVGFRLFLMQWRFAVGFDEPHYLQLGAAAVLFGWENLLHPYWPPMYPALIACMSVFSHNFELIGRMVNVILGSALVIPVYYLAKELFGKTTGLLAAIMIAVFPALAFSSTNALAESTYTFLSICGIAAGWFALKQRSTWKGAMAGAFFGMSYLTKPEGLGYLFVFLLAAGIWQFYHWRRHRKLALAKVMVIMSAIALVFTLPYVMYLKHATLEWTISGKYKVNRFDLNAINRLSPDNRESPLDMAYHFG
ncbi:MAG: ArnT family glycosyltransferase, partial [bacterium]